VWAGDSSDDAVVLLGRWPSRSGVTDLGLEVEVAESAGIHKGQEAKCTALLIVALLDTTLIAPQLIAPHLIAPQLIAPQWEKKVQIRVTLDFWRFVSKKHLP
jgi:hypothetical protein